MQTLQTLLSALDIEGDIFHSGQNWISSIWEFGEDRDSICEDNIKKDIKEEFSKNFFSDEILNVMFSANTDSWNKGDIRVDKLNHFRQEIKNEISIAMRSIYDNGTQWRKGCIDLLAGECTEEDFFNTVSTETLPFLDVPTNYPKENLLSAGEIYPPMKSFRIKNAPVHSKKIFLKNNATVSRYIWITWLVMIFALLYQMKLTTYFTNL